MAEKLQLEKGEMIQNPELIKQALFFARNFDKLDRRRKSVIRPQDRRNIERNKRIMNIVKRLKDLEEDLIAKKDPLSLENVKSNVRHIMEGKKGSFTGSLKIGFENDEIVVVDLVPLETDEDLSEIEIPNRKFHVLLGAIDDPDNADEEELMLAEGIPKEKIMKAVEMNAEKIIKTPFLRLDGSIDYKITAYLKQ